jgi:hypothetical protein
MTGTTYRPATNPTILQRRRDALARNDRLAFLGDEGRHRILAELAATAAEAVDAALDKVEHLTFTCVHCQSHGPLLTHKKGCPLGGWGDDK